MNNHLYDIFGEEILPGDFVLYADSTGFMVAVFYKWLQRRRIQLAYPHTKDADRTVKRGMPKEQHELIKITKDDIINYSGFRKKYTVDFIERMLSLSKEAALLARPKEPS